MRPYVTVNLAMSADGKISTRERRQVRISGDRDYRRVDALKAGQDAIVVGIGTVLADNPSLTVKSPALREGRRNEGKADNPVRVVVDSQARTPPGADLLRKGTGERVIAVAESAPRERVERLRDLATVIVSGADQVDLDQLLRELHRKGIRRLMVEGGGTLLWGFFSRGLVDEFCTFVGPVVIGGKDSPTPADGEGFLLERDFVRLEPPVVTECDGGVILRWLVKRDN
ncbi:MAG: 2,5-diamino-6-(ribosylamino)-4(3H)-pyrimidinone 5'-phosphate reductase [Methanomicrobiales archaeon]|nr:2,5-diamino-6-(ribosylamino)-4(3H)-pyrimidinone 5'-phosphate reductase [Methanomicrobiales archaeon]